jgi:hypothetical protein
MRESIPRAFSTFARALSIPAVLALGLASVGCSGEKKGEVILALQTDMSLPDDITRVKIEVKSNGKSLHDHTYIVDPGAEGAEKIPATLAIVAGEEDNQPIELKVIALRPGGTSGTGLEPRTLNKTVTTIPTERIAMLRVPMQWLCTGEVSEVDEGEYESNCEPDRDGNDTSCVAGTCKKTKVNSSKLPEFDEKAVFGGSDGEGTGGTCFPTEACFDAGETLVPDEDCVVTYSPESDEILNFAVLAKDGGICRETDSGENLCYVALDKSEEAGWYELEDGAPGNGEGGAGGASTGGDPQPAPGARRFQLPQKVCDRINETNSSRPQAFGVRVSTDEACEVTKTAKYPTCGPWSSVGKEVEAPEPPSSDEDGDGHLTIDVGGDDCNDADDTVHPGAVEVCDDSIDNNCNKMVDDCNVTGDADGDGVDSIDAGGTDCDDADNTVFPGAVEVCDSADNDCNDAVDDSCVADAPNSHRVDFSALDGFVSDTSYAIYQAFNSPEVSSILPFDLDQITIVFDPNSSYSRYTVTATGLDWDTDLGELVPITTGEDVSSCDDCYTNVPLEFPFNFYGIEYNDVFPSSNGYLTFGMGDETYSESITTFLASWPRISAFWTDLDTTGGDALMDEVYFYSSSTKLVVTYQNIQLYPSSGTSNTFQFVLFDDGTIKISYDGMDDLTVSSIAGITPGSLETIDCAPYTTCAGVCSDLAFDNVNCGACGNACAVDQFCLNATCVDGTPCSSPDIACDGTCVGTCTLSTPSPCPGTCIGTCSGTCSTPDGAGGCDGTCSGDCDGECYNQYGGECAGTCAGVCFTTAQMCPTAPGMKPCHFQQTEFFALESCSDGAIDNAGNQYHIQCNPGLCQCCSGSGCADTTGTANTVCQTETTMRDALIRQCLVNSACTGATCPSTPPQQGFGCNATDIASCSYLDGTFCSCSGAPAMFTCSGT